MKKLISISLILLVVLNLATPGYCYGPLNKLVRGVSNMLTCPLEIPYRMGETNKISGPYEAATYGFWNGTCAMLLRAAVGFGEVLSFPFPIPDGYKPILNDPEFFFEKPQAAKEK